MRWVCPKCGKGKLLGPRPRRDATGRYCLPCSEEYGRLVERTCPKLDAEREARSARRAAREARTAERESARYIWEGRDLRVVLRGVWHAAQRIEPKLAGKRVPDLRVEYRRSGALGIAYLHQWKILLRLWSRAGVVDTLVHEVAHFIGYFRGCAGHGDLFQVAHHELREEVRRCGLV